MINSHLKDKRFDVIDRHQMFRDYLSKMIERREIADLNKLSKEKQKEFKKFDIHFVLEQLLGKNWEGKTNRYYSRTMRSEKLYADLVGVSNHLKSNDRTPELIKGICRDFQAMEIFALAWHNWLMDESEVKSVLKEKGIEINEKNIQGQRERYVKKIVKFSKKKKQLRTFMNNVKKIGRKYYIKIGGDLVPFDKFNNFMKIIYGNMSIMMDYTAFSLEDNRDAMTKPMMDKMGNLFFEIEMQSRVKI